MKEPNIQSSTIKNYEISIRVNNEVGDLSNVRDERSNPRFNACFNCLNKLQIEIRVARLISKVLSVFKRVSHYFN